MSLEDMQHSIEAPSDADLIAELTEVIDAEVAQHNDPEYTDEEKAEAIKKVEATQKALEDLDAPVEEEPEPEPEPITAAAVAGEKQETQAPDRTILRDKLTGLLTKKTAEPQNDPQAELKQLRETVQALALGRVADPVAFLKQYGITPEQLVADQAKPESVAEQALREAKAAQEQAQQYQKMLLEQQKEREFNELRGGFIEYVKAQGDKYPLLNDGQQDLAFQAMYESIEAGEPLSEDEAMAHVEGKLREYVHAAALRLGYTAPGGSRQASKSSKGTRQTKTINRDAGNAPVAKAWDKMTDQERDDALIRLL